MADRLVTVVPARELAVAIAAHPFAHHLRETDSFLMVGTAILPN